MAQPAVPPKPKIRQVAANFYPCMKSPLVNLGTGIISTIGAAFVTCGTTCGVACCVPPVLSVLGLSSYAASYVSFVEPLKPYLIGLTIISLGYAFYKAYRKRELGVSCCNADQPVADCCKPSSQNKVSNFIRSKTFLWLITMFCAAMYAWPYMVASTHSSSSAQEQIQAVVDSAGTSQGGCCSTNPDDTSCNQGCTLPEN